MPVRYLSDLELARLTGWPDEIDVADAVTYFTSYGDDLSWIAGFNRAENRLGVMVQLCTLPWLGWIPDDLGACPSAALDRLAAAMVIAPGEAAGLLTAYGGWREKPDAPTVLRCWPGSAGARPRQLDGLLDVDPDLGITRLAWLRGATAATPEVLKAETDKLEFLRRHGADTLDLSRLPAGGGCWPRSAAAPPTKPCACRTRSVGRRPGASREPGEPAV
jgi:hypothetical protein